MEKLYRALAWLAGTALVLGLFFSVIWFTPWARDVMSTTTYGSPGSEALFLAVMQRRLLVQLSFGDNNVMNLLVYGATALAAALAWAERRWTWLAVLVVAALLTALYPVSIAAWQSMSAPSSLAQLPSPYSLTSSAGLESFLILVAPLIPVALALILALTRLQAIRPAGQAAHGLETGLAGSA